MKITYLPIEQFLQLSQSGNRGPDPLPKALAFAALLFVFTAILAL
jgi:hypothetical protein